MIEFCCSIYRKQRGRLKICSKSILFDPIDTSYPILKVHGCFVLTKVCQWQSQWKIMSVIVSRGSIMF